MATQEKVKPRPGALRAIPIAVGFLQRRDIKKAG